MKTFFTILSVFLFTFAYAQEYQRIGIKSVTSSSIRSSNCNAALSDNGGTATASSEGTDEGITHYASMAIDGDKDSFWASDLEMPASIVIEFDQVYAIKYAGFWWGSHQQEFSVSIRMTPNNDWIEVIPTHFSSNLEGSEPTYELIKLPTSFYARYLKVDITGTSAPSGDIFQAIIGELEAYSSEFTNNSISSFGTASSTGTFEGVTHYPHLAEDRNVETFWACDSEIPSWLKFEFNQVSPVSIVGVWWGSHQQEYSLSLSLDGNEWTTVVPTRTSYNTEGSAPVHEEFVIDPTEAKYIKVDITGTSAPPEDILQAMVGELQAFSEDCTISGISVNSVGNIRIYPNPAANKLTIETENAKDTYLRIYNLMGANIYSTNIKTGQKVIDISSFANGVYFVIISDAKGSTLLSEQLVKLN